VLLGQFKLNYAYINNRGLWYGFECIGNTPALLVNCADLPHDPTEIERKPAFDSSIPYDWQIQNK